MSVKLISVTPDAEKMMAYVARVSNPNNQENPNYAKELYIKQGGTERNRRTKKTCECGGVYIQRNKKIHIASRKHQSYIALNNLT